ncbi:MAG: hypothetical protein JSR44_13885 [Spirochaetes bacterium]|nr:hypothetical protein [Spirochaetota bacterium]
MKFKNTLLALGLIGALAITRFLPHPPNFTPVLSVAIFGAAVFSQRFVGILAALAAMALSDIAFGWHSTLPYVYGSMVLGGVIAFTLRKNRSVGKLIVVTLSSSILFFIVTNFGVFVSQNLYPRTLSGLAACYTMALPFLKNSLAGDLLFTLALFAFYHFLTRKQLVAAPEAA